MFYGSQFWPATSSKQINQTHSQHKIITQLKPFSPFQTQHNTVRVFRRNRHGTWKNPNLISSSCQSSTLSQMPLPMLFLTIGEICWSRCKYSVICYFPKFWISKYWWILGNFLEINHLIWYEFCWFGMDFAVFWYFHGVWLDSSVRFKS